jgi:hypothetical protein
MSHTDKPTLGNIPATYTSDLVHRAAMYYLMWCGQRGTVKQIDKLVKQLGPLVITMARQRGFKE